MKLTTVIGARPQFIKASFLSKEFLNSNIDERIIHTGQHYDKNMSEVFFSQLNIPSPAVNLGVSGKSHGALTGQMLELIEADLLVNKPEALMVYGDTDSTLAATLAAIKQHIPVIHVEAGLRSFDRTMPEEVNRVLTDHSSSLLLCPTPTSIENLKLEGIEKGVELIGDVMLYVLEALRPVAVENSSIIKDLGFNNLKETNQEFYLATIHRAENTNNYARLKSIMNTLDGLNKPIVMPLHPRTRGILESIDWQPKSSNLTIIDPQPYLDMLALIEGSSLVLTDSGGLQKEAVWMSTPCVTLRDTSEWVETIDAGWNILAGIESESIVSAVNSFESNGVPELPCGGFRRPVEEIVNLISDFS